MIDTLQAVRELQASGVDPQQAEAHVRLVAQIETGQFATLATKEELQHGLKEVETKLSTDISNVRAELSTDISSVRSEIKEVRAELGGLKFVFNAWSIIIALIGVFIAISSFFHR